MATLLVKKAKNLEYYINCSIGWLKVEGAMWTIVPKPRYAKKKFWDNVAKNNATL